MTETAICPYCGKQVYIFFSSKKNKEYFCDGDNYRQFHNCPNRPKSTMSVTSTPLPASSMYAPVVDADPLATARLRYMELYEKAKELSDQLFPNTSNRDASIMGIINFLQREVAK